uniref:Translocon-associated protein subunit alpha n=1 Tax=Bos indicus x Bos taurus TaxID=30522 RepID=A0A4W2C6F1_BOBOX
MSSLRRLLLLLLLVFPATLLLRVGPGGSLAVAQDLTEDEETVEDSIIEDEDDEAEVEEDEPTDLAEDKEEDDVSGEPEASPSADTTILFVKGEDFPANNIVKFLVGFTNKGTEDFIVESLDASFRYPQDYQFYIQNFTALPLNTVVPPQRQATFEYSFIPAEPMGGRPFGLVINLNYKDLNGNVFQDAVFNQTVTIIEREDGLDGETIFMYMFLAGLGLLVVVGLHQLLESRKRKRPIQKVEMGTSSQNDVDMSWIPQETLNQINAGGGRRTEAPRPLHGAAGRPAPGGPARPRAPRGTLRAAPRRWPAAGPGGAWTAAGRGLGGRLPSAPGGRASGPTVRPREPGAPARCSVRLRVPVTSTEPGSDGGPQTPRPRLAALRGPAQGGRGAAPWCLWERGLPPARLRRAGLTPRSDYADVTDLNRTESNWVEINGIQRLPTCLPLSLRARPGGEDRPCLRTSQAETALLRQERDGGQHGREGTEERDRGHHGREGTEREQQRRQWSRSGWRRTRTHADTFVQMRASRAWPVDPTCGITWKVPQADSRVSGSWPRNLHFQTTSTSGFEVSDSLRGGGMGRGVSVIPLPMGAFPRGCCPRPGTPGVRPAAPRPGTPGRSPC